MDAVIVRVQIEVDHEETEMPEGIGYPGTPVGRKKKSPTKTLPFTPSSKGRKGKKRPKVTGGVEPSTRGLRKRLVK